MGEHRQQQEVFQAASSKTVEHCAETKHAVVGATVVWGNLAYWRGTAMMAAAAVIRTGNWEWLRTSSLTFETSDCYEKPLPPPTDHHNSSVAVAAAAVNSQRSGSSASNWEVGWGCTAQRVPLGIPCVPVAPLCSQGGLLDNHRGVVDGTRNCFRACIVAFQADHYSLDIPKTVAAAAAAASRRPVVGGPSSAFHTFAVADSHGNLLRVPLTRDPGDHQGSYWASLRLEVFCDLQDWGIQVEPHRSRSLRALLGLTRRQMGPYLGIGRTGHHHTFGLGIVAGCIAAVGHRASCWQSSLGLLMLLLLLLLRWGPFQPSRLALLPVQILLQPLLLRQSYQSRRGRQGQ